MKYLSVPPYTPAAAAAAATEPLSEKHAAYPPLMDAEERGQKRYSKTRKRWPRLAQCHLGHWMLFLSSRQKEKSNQRSLIRRSRTRLIKLLATFMFCAVSVYLVRQFINYHTVFDWDKAYGLMKEIPSSRHIKQHFTKYAAQMNIAGSPEDQALAKWTQQQWIDFGLPDTQIETYYPLLNYPTQRRLAIVDGPAHLLYEATLQEDGDSPLQQQPGFHAYSGSGNVTAPVVYVHYGRLTDFQFLQARGVALNGTIALMRNGVIPKGLKVKAAETMGCVGALLYSDPADDGPKDDGQPSYPQGPWRSPTSVERGTVQDVSYAVGDPLTPGYAATENATRLPLQEAQGIPGIPSLPISWQDARPLLKATEGLGIAADDTWLGGLCNVSYFSGPSQSQINLINLNENRVKPVWNIISTIKGTHEPDRSIIIGNHRDAWNYGAVDPSSGSAVLMELVRTLGVLLKRGWRPQRTLIIASWDAEEYGAVGSTEWAEDHQSMLTQETIAYLNVDYAVSGKHFSAQASPLLNQLLYSVTREILDPDTSQTVYDVWKQSVLQSDDNGRDDGVDQQHLTQPLGAEGDHVAFFHHLGISSVSVGFRGDPYGVHHSVFDTVDWMDSFGDATFQYHQALAKIWGLLMLRLTSDPLLPMTFYDYATEIANHVSHLSAQDRWRSFPVLSSALQSLSATSLHFDKLIARLHKQLEVRKRLPKKFKKQVAEANACMLKFERSLLDPLGISAERPWFKHVVYGPHVSTGVPQAFPGLAEVVDRDNATQTLEVETRIARQLENAEHVLAAYLNKH